jgi:hypothetical protein
MPPVLVSESDADESVEIPELVAALDSHTAQFGPHHLQTIVVAKRLAIAFWRAGDIDWEWGFSIRLWRELMTPLHGTIQFASICCVLWARSWRNSLNWSQPARSIAKCSNCAFYEPVRIIRVLWGIDRCGTRIAGSGIRQEYCCE